MQPTAEQLKTTGGKAVDGAWYGPQRYVGGQLLAPGQDKPGNNVSADVIAQTNPNNVAYVNAARSQAGMAPAPKNAQEAASISNSSTSYQTYDPGAGGGGGGIGLAPPATINLPAIYQKAFDSAGIADLEGGITTKTKAYNDALSKINDNPWLSEGDRTGRSEKLRMDFNNSIQTDQNTVAMKKADIQMQLDLQTKQFDINSQSATQSMNQFNTLLQSGALDNASGSDIANLTLATGMSSSMIQSAISATKVKNAPTQVVSYDDGVNQGFAIIDPKTGDVIKKQVIAASKPSASDSGSGILNETRQLALDQSQAPQVLLTGAKMGKTLDDMMSYGTSMGVSKDDVYNIYSSTNYYKPTTAQQKADKKKYGLK